MRLRPSKPFSLVATMAWTWSLVLIVSMPVLLSVVCVLGVHLVEPFSESLIAIRARTRSQILTQIMLTKTWMLMIHPLIYRASRDWPTVESVPGHHGVNEGGLVMLDEEGIYE